MNAYVDSSVLLRIVLGERGRLGRWSRLRKHYTSELTRLECLRAIDRYRLRFDLSDRVVAARRAAVFQELDSFEIMPIQSAILDRAAEPFPTALASLDAIHLATAELARTAVGDLVFATHDEELGLGAQAVGFEVLGL